MDITLQQLMQELIDLVKSNEALRAEITRLQEQMKAPSEANAK